MKIELMKIPVRDIVEGYINSDEEGVVGYGGLLNIRPKYQREFIYKDAQQKAVIDTVIKGFPLNIMYWAKNIDGTYEVLDGQQRTISLCNYIAGDFAINPYNMYFHNQPNDIKERIRDYELFIYICEGTDSEKLDWFKTINIAGEKLYDQELRNAIYTGEWLTDAKKYFSKNNCPAYLIAKEYLSGSAIRQDYLETIIRWISNDNIEEYMSKHQHNPNANELWLYFQNVVNWVEVIFPHYRKEMKGIEWGFLYNEYKDTLFDSSALEREISSLMMDEDVTKKSGIYEYLLTREERKLNIRAFTPNMKREAYERQGGICPCCGEKFEYEEMEGDHVTPWHLGGKTISENCQMLCKGCNRKKSGI